MQNESNEHIKLSFKAKNFPENPLLGAGIYDGVLSKYIVKDAQYGKKIIFVVDMADKRASGFGLVASAYANLSPKSKLFGWLTNLGVVIDEGAEIDFATLFETQLKDMPVQIQVVQYKTNEGQMKNAIKELFPRTVEAPAMPAPVEAPKQAAPVETVQPKQWKPANKGPINF